MFLEELSTVKSVARDNLEKLYLSLPSLLQPTRSARLCVVMTTAVTKALWVAEIKSKCLLSESITIKEYELIDSMLRE